MNCEQINLLMIDYINGELHLDMNNIIKSHISDCPDCEKVFHETGNILEGIKGLSERLSEDPENKEFLKEGLLRELRMERANSPFLSGMHRRKEEIKKRILDRLENPDGDYLTG